MKLEYFGGFCCAYWPHKNFDFNTFIDSDYLFTELCS